LWFDELLTYYVSKLAGPGEVWRALEQTADGNPPLLYVLTHWSHLLFGESTLATRLPSLVALLVASGAFYFWIAERAGRAYGVLGMALLWTSRVFDYSYEARPYECLVALLAVTLMLWRRAVDRRDNRLPYLAGLGLLIACAMSSHYYAAFAFTGLAAGEVVRLARRRRPDWGVWAAGFAGGVTLLIYLPLIQAAREASLGGFWSPVHETDLVSFYVFFLYAPVGWAFASICVYLLFTTRRNSGVPVAPGAVGSPFSLEERAVMWVLAFSPTVTAIAAMLTMQPYVVRYTLPAMLGLVWLIVMMVWHCSRGTERPAWTAAAIAAALFFCYHGNDTFRRANEAPPSAGANRVFAALDQAEPLSGPVIVASPFNYFALWHRAPPRWKERLLYVTDPEVSRLMKECDTADVTLSRLAPWAGLSVVERTTFFEQNDRFLAVSARPNPYFGWLNDYLEARGAAHRQILETPDFVLVEYQGVTVETAAELATLAPERPLCR
jgi:hypothetical protein